MQCVSCHFENMPGSDICGRCGSSLRLATAVIDVHPPRAGRLTKQFRRFTSLPRQMRAIHAAAALKDRSVFELERVRDRLINPQVLRLPIPGWSQIHSGLRTRGLLFLVPWIVLLLMGLLYSGTNLGSMLLGLAFSVHLSAGMEVIGNQIARATLLRRFGYTGAYAVLLLLALYIPVSRLIAHWADPVYLQISSGPFNAGEVLLVNHAVKTFYPGQLVYFDIGDWRVTTGDHAYVVYTGERIDRVIAGPGDRVKWENGRLLVNGSESSVLPLLPGRLPNSFSAVVPRDYYLVFPSATPTLGPNSPADLWTKLSLIPAEQMLGKVYFRTQPIWKMKVLH